eukprot:EC719761.1.p1 GENE.EC719761.1~~EC719761.1.p1  ORF type:complete len:123 (+),score=10.35 EC719761.1:83-451(+)
MADGLDWRLSQAFGDKPRPEDLTDADIVTALDFDSSGNFIASGDKGGRIRIYERVYDKQPALAGRKPLLPRPAAAGVEYRFLTEFQSHEPEFDYLKSLEIEEKNQQSEVLQAHERIVDDAFH